MGTKAEIKDIKKQLGKIERWINEQKHPSTKIKCGYGCGYADYGMFIFNSNCLVHNESASEPKCYHYAWGADTGAKTATAPEPKKVCIVCHEPSHMSNTKYYCKKHQPNIPDPAPLKAQVTKLIGREVKFYNGKWYERDIDLRGPSIKIDRSWYRLIPKDDIEWAMGALEEYCREKPIIGEIICFSDYWKVVIKHPSVGMGTDAINKSPSEAICLAIVKHAGAK